MLHPKLSLVCSRAGFFRWPQERFRAAPFYLGPFSFFVRFLSFAAFPQTLTLPEPQTKPDSTPTVRPRSLGDRNVLGGCPGSSLGRGFAVAVVLMHVHLS